MNNSRTGIEKYLSNYTFSKGLAQVALSTSISDLKHDVRKFVKMDWGDTPPVWHLAAFVKDVIGSSIWVGRSGARTLNSLLNNPWSEPDEISSETHQYIINRIAEGKKIPLGPIGLPQIFQCLFAEISQAHVNGWNTTPLKVPPVKCTLVLVSGVLNELYRTAAFERAARHLTKSSKIKYFAPKVSGRKGTNYNAQLLASQLKDYLEKNPGQKLWLVGYSKGGLDCLHFMRYNKDFSEKNILGLSTIASPILGSTLLDDHLLLKWFLKLSHISKNSWFQKIDQGRDLLGLELQKSIAQSHQGNWFKKNHKNLPKNSFYTSLALSAPWYQSHLWMIVTKILFTKHPANDGIVDENEAKFPDYFSGHNFGTLKGHHLIGAQSSLFNQEALLEAHLVLLHWLKQLN